MKTPKEKRVSRRRERVKEDILDATRVLLFKVGVGSLTLAAIAEELELTKPALYHYFPSKDALLFELLYTFMSAETEAVEKAVAKAKDGPDAIERIIRTVTTHFETRLDELRLIYMASQVGASARLEPVFLERIRPLNDRYYGRAEELIRADQAAGIVSPDVHPRRAAFLAHCAALGVMLHIGMVDAGDEAPLIHQHKDLVDDLVRTHRAGLAI